MKHLAILATHPVQYFVPIFRGLSNYPDLQTTVYLGCLHGEQGSSFDPDFQKNVLWDCDVSSGYKRKVLTRGKIDTLYGFTGMLLGLLAAIKIGFSKSKYVMIFAYTPSFITIASLVLVLFGKKILLRADTTDSCYFYGRLHYWLRGLILSLYYSRCEHIYPIGTESFDHYLSRGVPASKLSTVLYAVDTSVIRPVIPISTPIQTKGIEITTPRKLCLAFVGKMTSLKDPLIIPRALRILSSSEQACISIISIGSGPLQQKFEELMHATNVEYCHYGFLNQSQLLEAYKNTDVLILPSVYAEVWGLVVNEALSQGLRVIASDMVGSRHDLITDSSRGFIFPAGSEIHLAHSITSILSQWPWPRTSYETPSPQTLVQSIYHSIK